MFECSNRQFDIIADKLSSIYQRIPKRFFYNPPNPAENKREASEKEPIDFSERIGLSRSDNVWLNRRSKMDRNQQRREYFKSNYNLDIDIEFDGKYIDFMKLVCSTSINLVKKQHL